MGKTKEELEAEYTSKPLQQQGVTAQSNAERSENINAIAGSEANKIPANAGGAPTTAFGEKTDSYAHLARTTVDARNRANKAEDEKEEKRLKAMRTLGTISNVVGGIGNLIAANAGAAPIKQDTSLLDEAKKGYADLLERKRKRANEDLEMLYSARSQDLKNARAEREAEKRRDVKLEEANARYEARLKEQEKRAEAQKNLEMFKQTKKMEYLQKAKALQKELEEYRQGQINSRYEGNLDSREKDRQLREAIANAENANDWGKAKLVEEYKPKAEVKAESKASEAPKAEVKAEPKASAAPKAEPKTEEKKERNKNNAFKE